MKTTQHTDNTPDKPKDGEYARLAALMDGPEYTKSGVFIDKTGVLCSPDLGAIKILSPWVEDAWKGDKQAKSNMAFIASCLNAFISAGERLGINPVLLAERLEKGGIAEIVDCIHAAQGDFKMLRNKDNYLDAWFEPEDYANAGFEVTRKALSLVGE